MKNIKTHSVLFIFVITVFFTADRFGVIHGNGYIISPFVYFLGITISVLQILLGRAFKLPVYVPLILVSIAYYICKMMFGGDMVDFSQASHVINALVEVSLLLGVTLMSGIYAAAISDFEDTVLTYLFASNHNGLKMVEQERKKIQIEIDRSRRHNHPLSVIVFKPEEDFYQHKPDPSALDVNKYLTKEFMLNKLGSLMNEKIRSHDLVFKLNKKGGLLLLCPETTTKDADVLVSKLKNEAKEQFGINLQSGTATFPDEFITFDELMMKAELSIEQPDCHPQMIMEYNN